MSEYHLASLKKNLYKIILQSTIYRSLNYEAANYFKNRSKALNIAIVLLSSTAGSLNFTALNLDYLAGGCSFAVTLLTVLKSFFKYDEKYQIHFNSFKEYREVISQVELLMMDDSISDLDFKKVETLYNAISDRMPSFDETFLERFKKENEDFIHEASKAGLVPDILTDYDAVAEGSLFNIYGHLTNKYNPNETSIKKNTFKEIVLARINQVRKLEEKEKKLLEKELVKDTNNENRLSMKNKTFSMKIEDIEVGDIDHEDEENLIIDYGSINNKI
jgi:hypothetical protein